MEHRCTACPGRSLIYQQHAPILQKVEPAFRRPNEFISCLRRNPFLDSFQNDGFVNLMINGFEPHGEQNLCIAISLLMDHVMEAGIALISWLPGQ